MAWDKRLKNLITNHILYISDTQENILSKRVSVLWFRKDYEAIMIALMSSRPLAWYVFMCTMNKSKCIAVIKSTYFVYQRKSCRIMEHDLILCFKNNFYYRESFALQKSWKGKGSQLGPLKGTTGRIKCDSMSCLAWMASLFLSED